MQSREIYNVTNVFRHEELQTRHSGVPDIGLTIVVIKMMIRVVVIISSSSIIIIIIIIIFIIIMLLYFQCDPGDVFDRNSNNGSPH